MLIQFRFSNFKSFENETILDLSATSITEYEDRIYKLENGKDVEKLLPCAAIYGANASGKSNFIEAISFMRNYVLNSVFLINNANLIKSTLTNENDFLKTIMEGCSVKPFLFTDSNENTSQFEVYFLNKNEKLIYNYGFELNADSEVIEEWLFRRKIGSKKEKEIFYRNKNHLESKAIDKKILENIETSLNERVLVLSLGAQLNENTLIKVRDWFLNLEILNFGNSNLSFSRNLFSLDFNNEAFKDGLLFFLSCFEPEIDDIEFEQVKNDLNTSSIEIYAIHKNSKGSLFKLPFKDESAGTQKMINLYVSLFNTISDGGTLIIDELSSRLHPILLRAILLTFLNPETNPNNAQIIFTLHDTWPLGLLRRDEIWFIEKDEHQNSKLYSLIDIRDETGKKIRKDENFINNYLLGKYGAIPNVNLFDFFKLGNVSQK